MYDFNLNSFPYKRSIDELIFFFPRLLAAILIFFIGFLIAKSFKKILLKLMGNLKPHNFLKKTPLSYFVGEEKFLEKIELTIGNIIFYLVMLIVITTTVSILGLDSLTNILNQILSYIPKIISASLIIFIGLLISGIAENLIKDPIKNINVKVARMVGKFTSYLIMIVCALIAFAELGIATDYIKIIFIGFVFMVTLSLGLAFGLGCKDLIKEILLSLYKSTNIFQNENIENSNKLAKKNQTKIKK